jgi:transposase
VTGRGPGPDDPYFQPALAQAMRRSRVDLLLADAGYDSEAAHVFARDQCGMRTLIPATRGRPTAKRLRGFWRNRMRVRFNRQKYGQRWQVETVNSMIKRSMDSSLRARTYRSQSREIVLRILTHNIMILRCDKVFYRAGQKSLFFVNPTVEKVDPGPARFDHDGTTGTTLAECPERASQQSPGSPALRRAPWVTSQS